MKVFVQVIIAIFGTIFLYAIGMAISEDINEDRTSYSQTTNRCVVLFTNPVYKDVGSGYKIHVKTKLMLTEQNMKVRRENTAILPSRDAKAYKTMLDHGTSEYLDSLVNTISRKNVPTSKICDIDTFRETVLNYGLDSLIKFNDYGYNSKWGSIRIEKISIKNY